MAERLLDTRGLSCPLPVLKAQKALRGMAAGERLRVLATDPKAMRDFDAFCEASGHRLVERAAAGDELVLVIERRP
jgi:tRNA 2-thiouridine synthesizing protein A